jgi:hypothetical protein
MVILCDFDRKKVNKNPKATYGHVETDSNVTRISSPLRTEKRVYAAVGLGGSGLEWTVGWQWQ